MEEKKIGKTDIDFNAAYLNAGRELDDKRASGGLGVFALGALTYKANKRVQLDAGMRFGLNRDAPRVGVFNGITVAVADFFKKR